jgi:hypothetical protein
VWQFSAGLLEDRGRGRQWVRTERLGHLILYTPSGGGYYFDVAGVYGVPRYMSAANFPRYLKENHKKELRRVYLVLPNPEGAAAYIEEALATDWAWWVLPHNCVSFCEEVIKAGGGVWSSYTNCPAIATDVPQYTIGQFLNELDSQIYRLYGVPR